MEIEKLIERLKSKDFERDYDCTPFECGVFGLLDDAASTLEQLQVENDRLKQERDVAVAGLHGRYDTCQHYTPEHGNDVCGSCVYEYPLFHRDGVVIEDRWQWAGIKEVKKNS